MNALHRLRLGLAALALVWVAGCDDGASTGGSPSAPPPGDVTDNGLISLKESAIEAAFEGGTLRVALPLRTGGDVDVAGRVQVDLVDLAASDSAPPLASQSQEFEGRGEIPVAVSLPLTPSGDDAAALAGYSLYWRVESRAGTLHGRRSLFSAWSQKTEVLVLGPDTFEVDRESTVRVVARDPASGVPRGNVPVTLTLVREGVEPRVLAEGMTDGYGVMLARIIADEAELGAGELRVEVDEAAMPVYAASVAGDVDVERTFRVLLTTDKPLYQPGQVIHLRALALRKPALTPEADRPLTFDIYDAKDNKIEHLPLTTDAYGVAHTKLRLAREVNLGTWRIAATLDDVTTEKTVTVDRYSLPKFDLKLDLDQPVYLAGDRLRGTVTARYFFGKAVAGGQVAIQAATVDAGENVFAELQGLTDAEGVYAFEMNLPDYLVGLPIAQGGGVIQLAVQVTDTAGQARAISRSVRIAKGPLEVSAVPESGALVPGLVNRIYLRSVDALGEPVGATHTVTFDAEVLGETTADESGLAIFEWPVPELEATVQTVTLTVATRDADGHEVQNAFVLSADPNAVQGAVLLRTDRALYRVGDTAEIDIEVTGAPDRVYLDVLRSGQTVLTQALTPDASGHARYSLDLGNDHAGALQFDAWYLAQGSSFRRDAKVVWVESANGLNIEITPDREIYAPGEQARLSVRVTDTEGTGKAAAIGLQGVDEAVYSLVEQRPGLEKVYFRVEGELAEPRYQVGVPGLATIASDPNASEDPQREQEAQVLFAATDGAAPGLSLSSWAGTEARTPTFVQPAIDRLGAEYRLVIEAELIRVAAATGALDSTALAQATARFGPPVDPFGKQLAVASPDGYSLTLVSMGPDEAAGTADDVSTRLTFETLLPPPEPDWDNEFPGAEGGDGAGPPNEGGGGAGGSSTGGDDTGPRVRRNFPETLFVEPSLITDGNGDAELTIGLADSITTWRVSALANSADGLIGSIDRGLTVFQDFFVDLEIPTTLTRGDEVGITLALYNYLPEPQTVNLEIATADWFTLLGEARVAVELAANEVRGLRIPLRVERVGSYELQVTARGTELSDAVARQVRVEPDGQKVERIASGRLAAPASYTTQIPLESVADSGALFVRLYPGLMSQVVTGLEGILQMPSGCFEQTSASTWPNVLVARYLRDTATVNPELEARAMEYINTGYQRLLTFEVQGGGFEWFGSPPAHVVLTAYGLLEFTDMAAVRTVDAAMLARTRAWLLAQQRDDGRWEAGEGGLDETGQLRDPVTITAYVAFALATAGETDPALDRANAYLAAHQNAMGEYTLALYGNFLAAWRPNDAATRLVIGTLAERVQAELDHWETDEQTTTYGNGEAAWIETTALATHALMLANAHPNVVQGALSWLVTKRSPGGAWGSTAGTVWSIKCLLRALSGGRDENADGTVRVLFDGVERASFRVTAENSDVMRQAELSELLMPGGAQRVEVVLDGEGNLAYDIVERWHMPWDAVPPPEGPLGITVTYDRTTLAVDDMVTAEVTITNTDPAFADMVMVDLGIPPGFALVRDDLEALRATGVFDRFENTERQLLLYFTVVPAGEPIVFQYRLRATEPVRAQSPRNRVYSYYNPDVGSEAAPVEFAVE
jgi:uncharacterized protein YfaS (alpha-2-macroglobulin family)